MMGMGQQMPMRRPPMGPSPMTAGRPNPMAGFQGGGASQPMAPWMRPPPPQMPPGGGGGVQVAQGQPPPGGWGSGGAPGYYPPDPNVQAMPLLQAPMGMGGGPQGMSDAMMHPFAPRNRGAQGVGPMQGQIQNSLVGMQGAMGGGAQGVGPNMILPAAQQMQGAMGGGPMQQMQGALGQMQGAMGGGMRPQRRFPGALGRGIMQAMAPPPQAAPPAPYGGQQFRMW